MHSTHKQNYQTIESPNLWLLTAYTHKSPDFRGAFIYYTDSKSSSLMMKKREYTTEHRCMWSIKLMWKRNEPHPGVDSIAVQTVPHTHILCFCLSISLTLASLLSVEWLYYNSLMLSFRQIAEHCVLWVCFDICDSGSIRTLIKKQGTAAAFRYHGKSTILIRERKMCVENELWMMMPMSGNRFALHNRT